MTVSPEDDPTRPAADGGHQPVPAGAPVAADRVRAELADLPDLTMPAPVAARIRHAILAEHLARPPAPTPDPDRRSERHPRGAGSREPGGRWDHTRRRRVGRRALVVAAAAAALIPAVVRSGDGPNPRPIGREDDLRSAGSVAFGLDGAGPLAEPRQRRTCLTEAGTTDPDAPLLGGTPHSVDGTPGTLVVLGTDTVGRYRVLVVDDGCRHVLDETTLGR